MHNFFLKISSYDISIHLRYSLIYMSEGLCVSPVEDCTLESIGTESRQGHIDESNEILVSEAAREVCDLYMDGAINATRTLNMTDQPEMIYHLNISCLHDVMTTNDTIVSE